MKLKLKLTFLALALIISSSMFGQTKECDCSGPLSVDLKDAIDQTQFSNFKNWLYIYYESDETKRRNLKSEASSDWSAEFKAIIEAVPIGGEAGGNSASSKDYQKYYRLQQLYISNRYISNTELNELFVEQFSDNQLKAYTECLKLCGTSKNGVKMLPGNDTRDMFYIKVHFNSVPAGGVITLSGNAVYVNMEPVGMLFFKDSLKIKDGQTITQYFKRLDVSRSASFTFNVIEGIDMPVVELSAKPSINQEAMPIGTIIASVLDYSTFLKVNNLDEMDNKDMATALWIPCDGRSLNVSKYAKYSGGKIPDLRGVFLRGINDYSVSFPSVVPVSQNQKNPENRVAGEFQTDSYKLHQHGFGGNFTNREGDRIWDFYGTKRVTSEWTAKSNPNPGNSINRVSLTSPEGNDETRPRNVTVYYYIKIN